jgi:predicted adenine nucleotide alpha hydrolase (AANH) superfamily ATPase
MQNSSSPQLPPIKVTCYSSHSYADRPTSFVWNGEQYDINNIEHEWLEPGRKHFVVKAARAGRPESEKRCHICYDTQEDIWQLKEIL